ncbi:DNA polymerase III subunit [Pseudofulvibacter geojedonensis]|uniref:ATP-binding protein n=1 Tax=Pseudofulvibacter geojedonensis TaxID=1123758 RepID=A0ABW3I5G6_9FLAO
MRFEEIIGQQHLISHLKTSADNGRIPHAQLFVGPEGSGTLATAIAYARYLLCGLDNEACHLKFDHLSHPDLHFAFPVATNDKVKKHPVSNLFLDDWRTFIKEQPYGNLFDWYKLLGVENKQGQIGVDEAQDIVKKLSLKSYEGGYKIMLIWMADKLNNSSANKLLKLIEEPPEKTVFLLITENEELIINTIRSRCQVLHFPALQESAIQKALQEQHQLTETEAIKIAQQANGNYNKAIDFINQDSEDLIFEEWFITWVRAAFRAKGNKTVINDLIGWSETIAKTGRETQKQFLHYCINFFRQALLQNYTATNLVYLEPQTNNFSLQKFAPFVHGNNILAINEALNNAIYHIERNGNAKIILTDLSIQLTRLLHKKDTSTT